jgi:chromosome segregation ATPase
MESEIITLSANIDVNTDRLTSVSKIDSVNSRGRQAMLRLGEIESELADLKADNERLSLTIDSCPITALPGDKASMNALFIESARVESELKDALNQLEGLKTATSQLRQETAAMAVSVMRQEMLLGSQLPLRPDLTVPQLQDLVRQHKESRTHNLIKEYKAAEDRLVQLSGLIASIRCTLLTAGLQYAPITTQ